ncbi:IS200/IS605 family transposase [Endozoicomonas montiporae CL-33]|uniref:IS200/IS605 family transposase n=1 Tax=Endozoicomonas montiporae CL-33 TaxID=570277 RepID=A0A142BJ87_9GAMM|nr:IS200/IS605 family transposase [Endozoicomonas montiporae CL-33]
MYMVFTDYAFENIKFKSFASFPNQLPCPVANVTTKNLVTVLGDKHKMILNFEYCMTAANPALSITTSNHKGFSSVEN